MNEVEPERVDARTYNAFLRRVDLVSVVLTGAEVVASGARPNARSTKVQLGVDTALDRHDERSFTAITTITASFEQADEPLGSVTARFHLTYHSAEPITDAIWREFGQRNVRANAWPYAREFIQSMTQRMGWPSFVLPVSTSPKLRPPRARPAPRTKT